MSTMSIFFICATILGILGIMVFFPGEFINGVVKFMREISLWSRQDFRSYCSLGGIYNDTTLIRRDGSLTSVIRLKGSKSIIGHEEYHRIRESFFTFLGRQMGDRQGGLVDLQIIFIQDPNNASVITRISNAMAATAKRIGLSLDDYLQSEINTASRMSHSEETYLVVTSKTGIKGKERQEEIKKEYDRIKKANLPKNWTDPSLSLEMRNPAIDIEERHEAMINLLIGIDNNLWMELLDADEVLKIIKFSLSPNNHPDWMPRLPGRKNKPAPDVRDPDSVPYPPIWEQIAPKFIKQDADREDIIEVDGIFYGVAWINLPPQTETRFSALSDRLYGVPVRISIKLWPAGLSMVKFNKMIVDMFSLFPKSYNRRIKAALDDMKEEAKTDNHTLGVAITVTTWSHDRRECIKQLTLVQTRLQGWGGCDVETQCGDGIGLLLSTIPALQDEMPAKIMPMTAYSISQMLPYFTPASVWDLGSVLFAGANGKLMPFQPGSAEQKTWNYLFFAPPGSGKSAMLNTIEVAMCLAPGQTKMPRIVVIDVGDSVEGPISLISSALPPERRSEALFVKLLMRPEFSFNVFDTDRGFRFPQSMARELITNFVTTIATPANSSEPPNSVFEMIGMLIDEAYVKFSDKNSPKIYEPNVADLVDAAIKSINLETDGHTTWWEITDAMFDAGLMREAEVAQRYAVPTLADLPQILVSPVIMDVYGEAHVGEEILPKFVGRMISSVLRDYAIFGRPTQFDLGQAKFIGIDLNEVKGTGESGKKQTALMYLFSMSIATKSFFAHKEMMRDIPGKCPEIYRQFHLDRIKELSEELKSLIMDEFHNTGGLASIRRMVTVLNLEGRKHNVLVGLSSQLIDHFDQDMIDSATGVFIMSCDSTAMAAKLGKRFGLSDSATAALSHVNKVGQFMGIFKTKDQGTTTHIMLNPFSPIKNWAFSTTSEDKRLRSILYEKLTPPIARSVLAKRYPKGVKGEFERRKMSMSTESDNDENVGMSIIDVIAAELLLEYQRDSA